MSTPSFFAQTLTTWISASIASLANIGLVAPSTVEYVLVSQGRKGCNWPFPSPTAMSQPSMCHVVHDVLDLLEYVPGRQRAQADAPLVALQVNFEPSTR